MEEIDRLPRAFLFKDACLGLVKELTETLHCSGQDDVISQLDRLWVAAQVVSGTDKAFSFMVYPLPRLTYEQRQKLPFLEEKSTSYSLRGGQLVIDFDNFGQICWMNVVDMPDIYLAVTQRLADWQRQQA